MSIPRVKSAVQNGRLLDSSRYEIISVEFYKKLQSWYGGDQCEIFPVRRERGVPVLKGEKITFLVNYKKDKKTCVFCLFDNMVKLMKEIRLYFDIRENFRLIQEKNNGEKHVINEKTRLQELKDTKLIFVDYRINGNWASTMKLEKREPRETEKPKDEKKPEVVVEGNIVSFKCNRRFSGRCGLKNLGNTCYFNSGVQCILHSLPLIRILLGNEYVKEINPTNPLGMKGKLVKAFSSLTFRAWEGNRDALSPEYLKEVVGEFAEQFRGYSQEDPHELIMFMLDGIHEDLNRCLKKPQVETVTGDGKNDIETAEKAWRNHKLRNDSIVVDNFHGQLRSRCICPLCHTTTVTFDPYVALSLPISPPRVKIIEVLYIPYDMEFEHQWIRLSVPDTPDITMYEKIISEKVEADVAVGFYLPVRIDKPPRLFWDYESVKFSTNYTIVAFEVPDKETNFTPMIINTKMKEYSLFQSSTTPRVKDTNLMAPFLVPVPKFGVDVFQAAVEERLSYLWREYQDPDVPDTEEEDEDDTKSKQEDQNEEINDEAKEEQNESIPQEEKKEEEETVASTEQLQWPAVIKDKSLVDDLFPKKEEQKDENSNPFKKEQEPTKVVSPFVKQEVKYDKYEQNEFDDMLSSEEIKIKNEMMLTSNGFDEGQRIKCVPQVISSFLTVKDHDNIMRKLIPCSINGSFMHKDSSFNLNLLLKHAATDLAKRQPISNPASKKISLDECFSFFTEEETLDDNNKWYCPHCRDFVCASKKMDVWSTPKCLVLQLKRFETTESGTMKDDKLVEFPKVLDVDKYVIGPRDEKTKYRLYAVSEHYGTLGFGHCTAKATVPVGEGRREWYEFNDSSCQLSSYQKTQTSGAYVLFYERIDDDHDNDVPVVRKTREFLENDKKRNFQQQQQQRQQQQQIPKFFHQYQPQQNYFHNHQNKHQNHNHNQQFMRHKPQNHRAAMWNKVFKKWK